MHITRAVHGVSVQLFPVFYRKPRSLWIISNGVYFYLVLLQMAQMEKVGNESVVFKGGESRLNRQLMYIVRLSSCL